jgi:hypothetical protein
MSNQSKGRKKSQFVAQTSIAADDTLDFVTSNVNRKIKYSDFIAQLGVTGTLEQQGDVAGTPVLNTVGTVNNIRNIEDGPGVKTSVSPQGGIEIEHDFVADTTGVPVLTDVATQNPVIRSLVAGIGINVAAVDDTVQISSTVPISTKTVIISQESDFPTPVAGVITLADNTHYQIVNDITTSNRFDIGDNCLVSGADQITIALTYTGIGVMYTATNSTFTIKNITSVCSSGQAFDISGSGTEVFQLIACDITCDTLGTIANMAGIQIASHQFEITTDGLTFSGSFGSALFNGILANIQAGTVFDLGTATFAGISFLSCFNTLQGTSKFLDGAANSANITTGGLGSMNNCRFFGTGTPLNTITSQDALWNFFSNDDVADTRPDGMLTVTATSIVTIPAVNTPAKIIGPWNIERTAQFTGNTNGTLTYDGGKSAVVPISVAISAEPVSGTNKAITFYTYIDGVQVANSATKTNIDAGNPKNTVVQWQVELLPTETVEIYVENNTDTVDIQVNTANMRVN